jgi:hypothetical protein
VGVEGFRSSPFSPFPFFSLTDLFLLSLVSKQYQAHGGLQALCGKNVTIATNARNAYNGTYIVTGGCGGNVCPGFGVATNAIRFDQTQTHAPVPDTVSFSFSS